MTTKKNQKKQLLPPPGFHFIKDELSVEVVRSDPRSISICGKTREPHLFFHTHEQMYVLSNLNG